MPAISLHSRRTTLPRAGLLPALAVGIALAPLAARANDRDLRGTPVPAAACIEVSRSGLAVEPWANGFFQVQGANGLLVLRCPLPVINVELSGTSDDNDISKFRVHYRDGDGFASGAEVTVLLTKTIVSAAGVAQNTFVCLWHSNSDGTGAAATVRSTKTCGHDIAAGAFYHFAVLVESGLVAPAQFLGIDFPP